MLPWTLPEINAYNLTSDRSDTH